MGQAAHDQVRALPPALIGAVDRETAGLSREPLAALERIRAILVQALKDGVFDAWKGLKPTVASKQNLGGVGHILQPRWKLQVFLIPESCSHPPHRHDNLASCMVVIDGTLHLREYEQLAEGDDRDSVMLRRASDREIGPGEGMTTTDDHRNVHWFGAVHGPATALNFKAQGYARSEPFRLKARGYLDPSAERGDQPFRAPFISKRSAHARFAERPL